MEQKQKPFMLKKALFWEMSLPDQIFLLNSPAQEGEHAVNVKFWWKSEPQLLMK
jgi:hypothetical protein